MDFSTFVMHADIIQLNTKQTSLELSLLQWVFSAVLRFLTCRISAEQLLYTCWAQCNCISGAKGS